MVRPSSSSSFEWYCVLWNENKLEVDWCRGVCSVLCVLEGRAFGWCWMFTGFMTRGGGREREAF